MILKNNCKKEILILVIILILGLIFRTYHVSAPFNGFASLKEAQFASMTQHFQERGDYFIPETHFEGINNNVFLPAWFILPFWKIFGNYEWAARFPFIIMGLISIILMYFIGGKLFSKKVGLFSAFFLAISPMMSYFSRNVQGESPLIFFSLLTIFFFLRFQHRKEIIMFYLSSFALLLAVLNKFTIIYLILPLGYLYWYNHEKIKLPYYHLLNYILIIIIPTITYMFYIKQIVNKAHFHIYFNYIKIGLTTLPTLLDLKGILYRSIHLIGGTNIITIILVSICIYKLKKEEISFEYKFIFIWIISYFITYLTFLNIGTPGNNYYLISFIPPLCLLAACGLNKLHSKMIIPLIVLSLIISIITLFMIYSVSYPYQEAGVVLKNQFDQNQDKEIFRIGDPTVCYYANHTCLIPETGDFINQKTFFLSISKASLNREIANNLTLKKFISENYILIYNITGKRKLINGNTFKKEDKEPEYELIYTRSFKENSSSIT